MDLETDKIVTVLGNPGMGKTTWARETMKRIRNHLIYDSTGDFNCPGDQFKVILAPKGKERIAHFERVCDIVMDRGNVFFGVDEADLYAPNSSQSLFELRPSFGEIIHRGTGKHHKNIGICTITRRAANMHKDIFSFTSLFVIFRLRISNDLDYIRKQGIEDIARIRSLKPYEFVMYDWEEYTTPKKLTLQPRVIG